MALARFKDLCLDASDAVLLGEFWASVLARRFESHPDGDGAVLGPTPEHTVWINVVPEAKSVKQRVHLDIYAASLEELERLGATVLEPEGDGRRWTVMADPEGGEFCAFLRAELPPERLHGLVVDCSDHRSLARWWGEVYGVPVIDQEQGYSTLAEVPGMPIETMDFVPVSEPKAVKNRIHWDVAAGSLAPLLDAGATMVLPMGDDRRWTVLADPEGNEFCAFLPA